MSDSKKYLITSALPYANGPIHLGHLAGAYLPGDIYARFCRLMKRHVIFICGTDEHGVPITITAEKLGKSPQEVVDYYHENIKSSFEKIGMSFDNFSRTSRPIHHQTSQEFFTILYQKGYMEKKAISQFYCEKDRMFLADRYIEGECPYCHQPGARGDQCENCGKWLEPIQLIEPRCKICGNKPEIRETSHYFLKLSKLQPQLEKWIAGKKDWRENVVNFCNNWFREGLEDRAVTRDLRWGVPVPLEDAKDKVLYVWFEAPIGYVSSTREWAAAQGKPDLWKEYWKDKENTRLIHFIGKDNIVFHAIIFPAMLMGIGDYVLPYNVPANEFMNLKGGKLSTSRNYAVWLNDYLEKFEPDSLRYSLAINMPESRDSDFSWEEFQARHNNELADILGNFVNRTLTFINKYFEGKVPAAAKLDAMDDELLQKIETTRDETAALLDRFQFKEALKRIMGLARHANKYFNDQAPWKSRKENPERCATTLNLCAQTAYALAILIHPFLPFSSLKIWKMLSLSGDPVAAGWSAAGEAALKAGKKLGKLEILFRKLDDEVIQAEIAKLQQVEDQADSKTEKKPPAQTEELITIDDFQKIKLRTAKIISAERIPKADRLLKLQIEVGDEKRQLVAGIAQHYSPEELPGKTIIIVANLRPAKIRGVESQGMLLAVHDGNRLVLVSTDKETASGKGVS